MRSLFTKIIVGFFLTLASVAGLETSVPQFFRGHSEVSAASSAESVYLGGFPVGITLNTEGVIVVGKTPVVTAGGLSNPTEGKDICCGDILLSINESVVNSSYDIKSRIAAGGKMALKLKRKNQIIETTITTAVDVLSGENRLGLTVKDEVGGIGTMTYVKENGRFGALGHYVIDAETGLSEQLNRGGIYKSSILGVVKGGKGLAGELTGVYNKNSKKLGILDKNNKFGVFGNFNQSTEGLSKIEILTRDKVKAGKAQIYTTVNGGEPDFYNIEIIKAAPQNSPKDKSMVISVTDSRLLSVAGGIVQGMSGSPIIQNGRLVGAVTHVFLNEPTKGYGVYIEWMLEN